MDNSQDRIIKKMIDNIVERNKPEFEKPEPVAGGTANAAATEDQGLLMRKLEYGFNSNRQENAEIRKSLDEIKGALNLMRNDLDSMRMNLQQVARSSAPPSERHVQQASPAGAPQYRKTDADEAFEKEHGEESANMPKVQQARGFQKKDDTEVDISKVFYYGKK